MAGLGGLLLALFILYFVFMLVAQFLIGQLVLFLGSFYIAYVVYKLCVDVDDIKKIYFYVIFSLCCLFLFAYVNSLFSDTSCDGYYIGRVFKPSYGPEQNGITISNENFSNVCGFPGFRHACSQYSECKSGFVVFKPFQLFLLILLCASLGASLGFLININLNLEGKVLSSQAVEGFVELKNLSEYYKINEDFFKNLTVQEIAVQTGRTERYVKSFITRNKLKCQNYGN